ncbi:MAG: prephenate dehydratase [Candidatus Hydrogenedentota bacterium]
MTLDELRSRIDTLDAEIVARLNERAECALAIGRIKQGSEQPYYVPEREKAVFERLYKVNGGPLTEEGLRAIYREIISATRALEKPTTVGFLGPRDTFSHMAALRVFGMSAQYHPLASFRDIFTEVERRRLDYGIVPVESSVGGSVSDTLDLFITSELRVVNEVLVHITQNLLSKSPLDQITHVYSKDNALLQCRQWLRANAPNATLLETASTADAAQRAAQETGAAAIASRLAAETYGLDILAEHIEDESHNYTRFFVVGRQHVGPTGNDKTALLVSIQDRPGALYNMLVPFAEANITLTRIESRPSRQKAWEYVFFIDLLGHADELHVQKALERVGELSSMVKILGAFPRAQHID